MKDHWEWNDLPPVVVENMIVYVKGDKYKTIKSECNGNDHLIEAQMKKNKSSKTTIAPRMNYQLVLICWPA